MGGLIKFKFKSFSSPTWDELAVFCSKLNIYEPCFFSTSGTISGYGSSAGSFGVMVNRGVWQSVTLLGSDIAKIEFQVSGDAVTRKTQLAVWQNSEQEI